MNDTTLKCIRRVKKKIGDVIEIPTSKGLAYVQYTHEHKTPPMCRGSLIRVLQGFYEARLSDEELAEIVKKPHRFQTFCSVHYEVNLGLWERVGNFPVPDFAQKFPIFKGSNNMPKTDPKKKIWWLWDGEKEWRVGKLSLEEQKKYPLDKIADGVALVSNIETGKSIGRELC